MRKYLFLIILSIVFCALVVFIYLRLHKPQCELKIASTPYTYIATAFQIESDAVFEYFDKQTICKASNGIIYSKLRDKTSGFEVVHFLTGVGPQQAKSNTYKTIKVMKVKNIIFSGIAGLISKDIKHNGKFYSLKVGDTVIVKSWYSEHANDRIDSDTHLLELAAKLDGAYLTERGYTASKFIDSAQSVSLIKSKYNPAITDMETYEIAYIASTKKIPFLAIRSVSDYADGTDSKKDFIHAAENSAFYLDKLLEMYFTKPNAL